MREPRSGEGEGLERAAPWRRRFEAHASILLIFQFSVVVLTLCAFSSSSLAESELPSSQGAEAGRKDAAAVDTSTGGRAEASSVDTLNLPPRTSVGGAAGSANRAGPGLDALLKLPNQYRSKSGPAVAGTSETQWRKRFRQATGALIEARRELAKNKVALDSVASSGGNSQWSVAAPGGGAGADGGAAPNSANSPVSFKLRQELRANRVKLEEAEKALRELTIQADLAGVPEGWRGTLPTGEAPPPEVGQLLD